MAIKTTFINAFPHFKEDHMFSFVVLEHAYACQIIVHSNELWRIETMGEYSTLH